MKYLLKQIACLALVATTFSTSHANAQAPIEPLLQKYCLNCHNENDKESGLSLQTPESLKKGGENGPVYNPGTPAQSLLYKVLSEDADSAMPPEGEPQPSNEERELLKKWVLAGAKTRSMAAGPPDVPKVTPFHSAKASLLASSLSPDGKLLILGGSRHVTALHAGTSEVLWEKQDISGKVSDLTFANRNPWIVVAAGMPGVSGQALLLSSKDGSVVKTFSGHTDAVYAAVVNSSDSLLATAGYDRRIVLHDLQTGEVVKTLDGHNGSVFSLCFDPTGKILCSASADGTVKVWHTESGKRLDTLSQPQAEQYSVVVSKDGQRIYAAGADNRIRVWDFVSRSKPQINPQLVSRFAHEQPITCLTMSPDGRLLASSAEDGTVNVWTAWPLNHLQALPRQESAVTSLTISSNEKLIVTRLDGSTESFKIVPAKASTKDAPVIAHAESKKTVSKALTNIDEAEGNNTPDSAQKISLPALVSGVIRPDGGNDRDVDCFRFSAVTGQKLILEVNAQRDKSPLDSKIEVLSADGQPILQAQLQAVRDSYFTFRGKDSDTSNDFRVFNWQEMELNEYMYADGEVVKLWLYPRGPDSGYKVYPGFGKRFTYFGTTPTAHALQAPCFIVVPRRPNEKITANGLPVFPVYYENDDDGRRELGSDSRLHFTAPTAGDFVVRVTDARGFSGEDYKYKLTIRTPKPSFSVSVNTRKVSVQAGTGRELVFTAKRIDGYEGPISIDAMNLPTGFAFSGPIVIQKEQLQAFGTLHATDKATEPTAEQVKAVRFLATTDAHGKKELGGLEELKLTKDPRLRVRIGSNAEEAAKSQASPVTLQIRPGETIRAVLHLERNKHNGVVSLGKEDAGRNMPHGVFVDNIGLNGLLLLADQSEREFYITAAKWVPPSKSTFYLKANIDAITSFPVILEVLPAKSVEEEKVTAAVKQ